LEKYIYKGIKDFDLDHIFDCGQCFRWTRQEDGSYTGIAFGRVVNMQVSRAEDGVHQLEIDGCCEEDFNNIWHDYLDMGRDYSMIKSVLAEGDPVMAGAIRSGEGIRILKQDLWETIVSFIISQNNNIPRIKGCIENLCRLFGEKAGAYGGEEYYNIPTPEKLASLTAEDLAPVRLGYRAPYLIETAQQVLAKGGMEKVAAELALLADPEEVCEYLRQFQGVGPKVASCIALFGLARLDAFPIDVWVRRVMNRLYDIDEKDVKAMSNYAREHFGENGGIAQQYLFYYIRGINY